MFLATIACLALADPTGVPPAQGALLSVVPDDAFALATCLDPETLKTRLEENEWAEVLGGPMGEPFLSDVDRELHRRIGNDVGDIITLGKEIQGECVLFVTQAGTGFVADPPPSRDGLLAALREWAPVDPAASARGPVTIAGAHVQLYVRADDPNTTYQDEAKVTALVDHPNVLGLFGGAQEEQVLALVRSSLAGLGTQHKAPVVASLLNARRALGALDLELFVDCTPFVADAERELARVGRNLMIDPTGLLGLEKGTWFYTTAGVFPGRRLEWRAHIEIPQKGLAARLADTFRPLPNDLLAGVPKSAWNVHALNWDVVGFYDRVRKALAEADQGQGAAVVDQGLAMAKEASGVDLEKQLFRQLEGVFTLYLGALQGKTTDPWDELRSFGLALRVADGAAFQEAVEALSGMALAYDEVFVQKVIAGTEAFVYQTKNDGDWNGAGIAFLPRTFVLALNGALLEESLRAQSGDAGASLLSGTDYEAGFDENLGACGFFAVELANMRRFARLREAKVNSDEEAPPDPFQGLLVGAVKRTPQGFDLQVYTR